MKFQPPRIMILLFITTLLIIKTIYDYKHNNSSAALNDAYQAGQMILAEDGK